MTVERLAGPSHIVTYDVPRTNPKQKLFWERDKVSVVNESELQNLEKYFAMPMHQQIALMQRTVKEYTRENKAPYPAGTLLLALSKSLDLAHDMAFAHFATGLTITEVLG